MSNRRTTRAGAQHRRDLRTAALVSARVSSGCICDPELEIRHDADGQCVKVAHDDWCPAIDAPSRMLAVIRPGASR